MNLLLDTHILLWWLADSPELDQAPKEAIGDRENVVFISAASLWEIMIKKALGKLDLPDEFEAVVSQEPFLHLEVSAAHAFMVGRLPPHHRDPFDRMLIAQALVEGLTLVTADPFIRKYEVPVLHA
ncbi:type II toxin-antitoxin system VapC family toxin [Candidatus Fermentibacteria bacterium]|nr:type II toxin-antitoxin system VapC family toxin [Candidatus Fermentibacteria bacterium]